MLMPKSPPPKVGANRVDFDMDKFRKLVHTKGLYVWWEAVALCPCGLTSGNLVASGSGLEYSSGGVAQSVQVSEHNPSCPSCHGHGEFFHSRQIIRVIITRTRRGQPAANSGAWGELMRGEAYLTFEPEHLPYLGDRFTLRDSVLRFQELRTRTADAVESLRYPVVKRTVAISPTPRTFGVLAVFVASPADDDANGFVTPVQNSLVEGVDFDVDENGALDWTKGDGLGSAPEEGARFSVDYYCNPVYRIVEHPYTFRDTEVRSKQPEPGHQVMLVQSIGRLEQMGGPEH